jgi:hypothetical protein
MKRRPASAERRGDIGATAEVPLAQLDVRGRGDCGALAGPIEHTNNAIFLKEGFDEVAPQKARPS